MQNIGRYEIIRECGRGGMAVVYQARDPKLDRVVAIKLIQANAFAANIFGQVRERFEREARALARLDHSNIVKVLDFGEYEGAPYLVMEYLEGVTLKEVKKPLRVETAVRLLRPIADALNYVHNEGMLHRDVKPSNIMITKNERVLLTDFGIAKWLEEEDNQQGLTGTGVGIGTPEYMSPEQGLGKKTDGRADEYSLSIVFYELITGRKPFRGDTALAVLMQQANEPVPDPREFVPDLNESVKRFFDRALAKKPEDRYGEMKDYLRDLDGLALQSMTSRAKEAKTGVQLVAGDHSGSGGTRSSVLIGKSDLQKIRQAAEASAKSSDQPVEKKGLASDRKNTSSAVAPAPMTEPKIENRNRKRRSVVFMGITAGLICALAAVGLFNLLNNGRTTIETYPDRELIGPEATMFSKTEASLFGQETKAAQATRERLEFMIQQTSQAEKVSVEKTLNAAITQAAEADTALALQTTEAEKISAQETLNAAIAQTAEMEKALVQQTSDAAMLQATDARRTVDAMELTMTESSINTARTETVSAYVPPTPTRVPTKTPVPPTPTRSIGEIEAALSAAAKQGFDPFLDAFERNLPAIKEVSDRIRVPAAGKIDHVAGNYIQIFSDGNILDIQDFIFDVKMESPYAVSFHDWDFGVIFRFINNEHFAQLMIFSDKTWKFLVRAGSDNNKEIASGTFGGSLLRITPNFTNSLRIVANGDLGLFYLNDRFISKLDLSDCADSGGLSLGIGFYDNMKVEGYSTEFNGYSVWDISNINIGLY